MIQSQRPATHRQLGAQRRDETGAVAPATITRTEAILRAVCQELEAQRTKIDRADDLDMLVIGDITDLSVRVCLRRCGLTAGTLDVLDGSPPCQGFSTIGRRTHYDWLAHDDEYARRFAEADVVAIDKLEEEARRRALAGVNEPVFYQGKIVGHVARKSDTLLIFLLKGKRPEVYTERHEHTGAHGQAIRVASTALLRVRGLFLCWRARAGAGARA